MILSPLPLSSLYRQEEHFFGKCFSAMEVDAFNSSHPVSTPVENPAQIREMFDDVSYEKVKADCRGTAWILCSLVVG